VLLADVSLVVSLMDIQDHWHLSGPLRRVVTPNVTHIQIVATQLATKSRLLAPFAKGLG